MKEIIKMKQTYLLGAGASVEAGIPGSYDLTEKILSEIESDPRYEKQSQILKLVIGGLLFQSGAHNSNPLLGVNIEDLFNTIQDLSNRNSANLSPFVAAWHPILNEINSPTIDTFLVRDFIESIIRPINNAIEELQNQVSNSSNNSFRTHRYNIRNSLLGPTSDIWRTERNFISILNQLLGGSSDLFFRYTNDLLLRQLRNFLIVRNSEKLEYLFPLIKKANNDNSIIATLNYDNCIETVGKLLNIKVDTGFDSWSNTREIKRTSDSILLLKLHGSIDWILTEGKITPEKPMPFKEINVQNIDINEEHPDRFDPAIIFGGKNKLQVEGPYLDMLRVFEKELEDSESLVSIGYSFRDEHINSLISEWINNNINNHITIIDPKFDKLHHDFSNMLHQLHGMPDREDRVTIIYKSASEGIYDIVTSQRAL